jgi:hypothetical protein
MKNDKIISPLNRILITPFFILLSHHLIVFIHEYAHTFTAWMLGYKSNPLELNYGGTSLSNLLLLSDVDHKVNYEVIYSLGNPRLVGLIAFAGPGVTLGLFFLSGWLIQTYKFKIYPPALYFLLFCNLWCLGGTYAYVPIRVFTTHGVMVDILDIEQALHISPWIIYFFGSYLVVYMMRQFFSKNVTAIYADLRLSCLIDRASLMILFVFILFGYCSLPGFSYHGEISHFISVTSILAIPGLIFILWSIVKNGTVIYKHNNDKYRD